MKATVKSKSICFSLERISPLVSTSTRPFTRASQEYGGFHVGDSLGAGVAVQSVKRMQMLASQPGNEGSNKFITFLFCLHKLDLVKEVRLLLHSGLIDLLPQVVNCDG